MLKILISFCFSSSCFCSEVIIFPPSNNRYYSLIYCRYRKVYILTIEWKWAVSSTCKNEVNNTNCKENGTYNRSTRNIRNIDFFISSNRRIDIF